MSKAVKMTRKDAYCYGYPVVKLPYGAIYYLTTFVSKSGYNAGIYGWNWDAYIINGVVFCCGYRNLPGSITKEERALVGEYETEALNLCRQGHDKTVKQRINALLAELCEKIKADRA